MLGGLRERLGVSGFPTETGRQDEAASTTASTRNRALAGRKFMQTLDDHVYRELEEFAMQRGVTIQGLIRAVIVPEWITSQGNTVRLFSAPQLMSTSMVPELQVTRPQSDTSGKKSKLLVQQ